MFKWLDNIEKEINIYYHIKLYEIQLLVSMNKVSILFMDTDIFIGLWSPGFISGLSRAVSVPQPS